MKEDAIEEMEVTEEAIDEAREKVQDMKDRHFKKADEESIKPAKLKDDAIEEMKEIEEEIEEAREKVQDMKDGFFKKK